MLGATSPVQGQHLAHGRAGASTVAAAQLRSRPFNEGGSGLGVADPSAELGSPRPWLYQVTRSQDHGGDSTCQSEQTAGAGGKSSAKGQTDADLQLHHLHPLQGSSATSHSAHETHPFWVSRNEQDPSGPLRPVHQLGTTRAPELTQPVVSGRAITKQKKH